MRGAAEAPPRGGGAGWGEGRGRRGRGRQDSPGPIAGSPSPPCVRREGCAWHAHREGPAGRARRRVVRRAVRYRTSAPRSAARRGHGAAAEGGRPAALAGGVGGGAAGGCGRPRRAPAWPGSGQQLATCSCWLPAGRGPGRGAPARLAGFWAVVSHPGTRFLPVASRRHQECAWILCICLLRRHKQHAAHTPPCTHAHTPDATWGVSAHALEEHVLNTGHAFLIVCGGDGHG